LSEEEEEEEEEETAIVVIHRNPFVIRMLICSSGSFEGLLTGQLAY
jgi:hypothetical protein